MFTDFVLNGEGHGPVGNTLGEVHFDPGLMRPYFNDEGERVVLVNTGRTKYSEAVKMDLPVRQEVRIKDLRHKWDMDNPVWNATSMRKGGWIQFDNAVVEAARARLRAWGDLAASSTFGGFNGMGKMTLEYEAMNDPGEAVVDMDAITDARHDEPLFKLRSIPLPITHSDFWFSQRRLAVSRNTGTPLDTTMARAAGRRVAEMIERTVIGTETGMTYGTQSTGYGAHDGTSTIYGYTNTPYRITKTDLNTPTGSNPEAVLADVLEMIDLMYANNFYGPFILYHSTGYSRYLSDDYFRTGSTSAVRSLRSRLLELAPEGIQDIRRLDFLTSGFQLILVQMDPETAQAINAMDLTTIQWESQGGMRRNFKVMSIQLPLIRAKYNGTTAIVHGTTS